MTTSLAHALAHVLAHFRWSPGAPRRARRVPIVLTLAGARAEAAAPLVRVDLLSEQAGLTAGGEVWIGIRQRIAPGWHTYWTNPGDSGEPMTMEWTLPPGFAAGPIVWPHPERIPVGPAMSHGYTGEVVLLARLTAPPDLAPGRPVTIGGRAAWLVCEKTCIPEEARVELTLPVVAGRAPASPDAPLIAQARRAVPVPSPVAGHGVGGARARRADAGRARAQRGCDRGRLVLSGPVGADRARRPARGARGRPRSHPRHGARSPPRCRGSAGGGRAGGQGADRGGNGEPGLRDPQRRAERGGRRRGRPVRPLPGRGDGAGAAGRAPPEPHALRAAGAVGQGALARGARRHLRRRSAAARPRAYRGCAGMFRRAGRRAAGAARERHGHRLGLSASIPPRGDAACLPLLRAGIESLRRAQRRRSSHRRRARPRRPARLRGLLLHGRPRRGGGHALHRAVHGRGHRLRPHAAGAERARGVPGAGPRARVALSGPQPGAGMAAMAAPPRPVDGAPQAGAGVSALRDRRLARLGGERAGGPPRHRRRPRRPHPHRVRRLDARDLAGRPGPAPHPRRGDGGGGRGARARRGRLHPGRAGPDGGDGGGGRHRVGAVEPGAGSPRRAPRASPSSSTSPPPGASPAS